MVGQWSRVVNLRDLSFSGPVPEGFTTTLVQRSKHGLASVERGWLNASTSLR